MQVYIHSLSYRKTPPSTQRGGVSFLFFLFPLCPLDMLIRLGGQYEQRYRLINKRGVVQPVPFHLRACHMTDGVFGVQNEFIQHRKLRFGRDRLVDDAEFEAAYSGFPVNGIPFILQWQFAAALQILHDLTQVHIHTGTALKAQIQANTENTVAAVSLHLIIHGHRLVQHVDTDKPVGLGTLGILIQNRVENIAVNGLNSLCIIQIHQRASVYLFVQYGKIISSHGL